MRGSCLLVYQMCKCEAGENEFTPVSTITTISTLIVIINATVGAVLVPFFRSAFCYITFSLRLLQSFDERVVVVEVIGIIDNVFGLLFFRGAALSTVEAGMSPFKEKSRLTI